jgi:hypothetical protein
LNEAIRRARGEIIIRLDVHSEYAPDYIAQCLAVLDETGARNVGGPARTMAEGYLQRAIATAYHSGFACGRAMELLQSIQGRDTDVVFTPSGNRLIVHFFTGVLEHFPEIECFQVVQREYDAILVRVVPASGWRRESAVEIAARLRAAGMEEMRIQVDPVREIPVAPSGKRRFVICELPRKQRLMEVSSAG